jgi:hypothetical protein
MAKKKIQLTRICEGCYEYKGKKTYRLSWAEDSYKDWLLIIGKKIKRVGTLRDGRTQIQTLEK